MRFLEKSRGITVDTIAYDLEDSVTPGKKAEARHNLRDILSRDRSSSIKEQAVRINSVDSGYALDDLTEVACTPAVYHWPHLLPGHVISPRSCLCANNADPSSSKPRI